MTDNFAIKNNKLTQYRGQEKIVVIPEGITEIGKNAFFRNRKIKKVILPHGVITIGNNAFAGCENLTELNLPDTVQNIGDCAKNYLTQS